MLGDVLLINENHKKGAQQILDYLTTRPSEKLVLAIGGESGSGKSEVAHLVARGLKKQGTPAKIMHIDNYYATSPGERTAWRKEHGLESVGYTEYRWQAIHQTIQEFLADQDNVVMPCVDLLTDQVDLLHTSFHGLRYLIIEGLYALKAEADLKIMLGLTYHETKEAQSKRGKEPTNEFRWQVLEREHTVIQSLRTRADLLLTGEFDLKTP